MRTDVDSRNIGSGLLFFWRDQVLLVLRSFQVSHPFTWGTPGGMLQLSEIDTPISDQAKLRSAIRECREEMGTIPQFAIFDQTTFQNNNFQYTTFLCHLHPNTIWNIKLNWEHIKYCWYLKNKLPHNLHPGVKYVIKSLPQYFK